VSAQIGVTALVNDLGEPGIGLTIPKKYLREEGEVFHVVMRPDQAFKLAEVLLKFSKGDA